MDRSIRLFLISAAGTLFVLMAAFTGLLYRNAELYTVTGGAREQLRTNGIYLRSIWHDYYPYKLAMYQLRPTTVMSVGSSRAMGLRSFLFRDGDHYSAGGVVQGIADAEAFVGELRAWPIRPKALLLHVDFAWFIETGLKSYNTLDRRRFDRLPFVYQSAFVHFRDLALNAFKPPFSADPDGAGRAIGARAQRTGDGFRVDGSMRFLGFEMATHYDEPELYPLLANPDRPEVTSDAETYAKRRRWWGGRLDAGALERFAGVLDSLAGLGIDVLLIMPPVAPHLARALRTRPELAVFGGVMAQLGAVAAARRLTLLDYTEIPMWDADCWVDRYHASEGAYGWMLKAALPGLVRGNHPIVPYLATDMLDRIAPMGCARSLTGLLQKTAAVGIGAGVEATSQTRQTRSD